MSKDDVIRMAREAGWKDLPTVRLAFAGFDLERFAALVAAAAKEEMLMAGNDQWLEEARKAEREACAKVCDAHTVDDVLVGVGIGQSCAAAIRARSQA